jgi:hypothetical protein
MNNSFEPEIQLDQNVGGRSELEVGKYGGIVFRELFSPGKRPEG